MLTVGKMSATFLTTKSPRTGSRRQSRPLAAVDSSDRIEGEFAPAHSGECLLRIELSLRPRRIAGECKVRAKPSFTPLEVEKWKF
jgi:hypothetical protein